MSRSHLFGEIEEFFDDINGDIVKPNNNGNLSVFYGKLEQLGFNLDELMEVLECPDSMLVLSGAGSGKTSALILKIIRDLISGDIMKVVKTPSGGVMIPGNILVSTFLKSGAEDLKRSFNDWCNKLNLVGVDSTNIKFKTIHAEVYDALKLMGVNMDILLDTASLIRRGMTAFNVRSVLAIGRNVTIDEVSDVSCILAYARNRLDDKKYMHSLMGDYGLDKLMLDALLLDFKKRRNATGKMDFEDMQEVLLQGLKTNPAVVDFISSRYDYVYVDEFQDTSQLQYELLKYYFNAAKKVIAIGDDDQTIYSWRGSDIDIISSRFEKDYKPAVKQLTINYRCAKNILEAVIPSIEKNSKRHEKKLKAFRENGVLNIVEDGNVNLLLESIKKDLTKYSKVGVLARTNADLLVPAMLLELDGALDFSVSKSVTLNMRLSKQVFGLIDLVIKRFSDDFENHFRLFLNRYNYFEAEKLASILRVNKDMSLYNIPMDDLLYSAPMLAPLIKGLRTAKEKEPVMGYIYLLDIARKNVFAGKSIYAKKARGFIQFIKKLILEHDSLKDMNINQLDRLFNSVLPERLSRRAKYGKGVFVNLSTVHDAKGKEWDSVYIWNDVEGCFPNYVGNRELTVEEYEEERRVHYIAWTRAKDKLTVFTSAREKGSFLNECDLDTADCKNEGSLSGGNKVLVYRKTDSSEKEIDVEVILRSYIVDTLTNGNLSNEKVVNVELVISRYDINVLVDMLKDDFGIGFYPEEDYLFVLDDFFASVADKIFNTNMAKGD